MEGATQLEAVPRLLAPLSFAWSAFLLFCFSAFPPAAFFAFCVFSRWILPLERSPRTREWVSLRHIRARTRTRTRPQSPGTQFPPICSCVECVFVS